MVEITLFALGTAHFCVGALCAVAYVVARENGLMPVWQRYGFAALLVFTWSGWVAAIMIESISES